MPSVASAVVRSKVVVLLLVLVHCFLHTGKGYLRFYPGIENLILRMLSYPGSHVRATYIGCIGTHAFGHKGHHCYVKVTPLCENAF